MRGAFSKEAILRQLNTRRIGKELIFMEETGSTNADAKAYGLSHPGEAVFVAAGQTGGRGRMTRSFVSPEGMGIYLSVLLRPNWAAMELNTVTLLAAVAVSNAVARFLGEAPAIKWTNDLYLAGKKICGILTECSLTADGGVQYAVIGIGVNLYHQKADFPEELWEKAGSILSQSGKEVDRSALTAAILEELEQLLFTENFPQNKAEFLRTYKERMLYLNEEVDVVSAAGSCTAVVRDLDEEGRLVVETIDGMTALNSAEISIRQR